MSNRYSPAYFPSVPIVQISLAYPGEAPRVGPLIAMIDTGSDGTIIPTRLLERVEAAEMDSVTIHGLLGGSRRVRRYKVDLSMAVAWSQCRS